jgi:hypothetical protein
MDSYTPQVGKMDRAATLEAKKEDQDGFAVVTREASPFLVRTTHNTHH